MVKRWTVDEVNYLKDNYYQKSLAALSSELERSEKSVATKAYHLGMKKCENEWREDEVDFLKKNYQKMLKREMADELGRTYYSVEGKMKRLGLKKLELYSEEEIDDLLNLKPNDTIPKISKRLGRSKKSVEKKMVELGVTLSGNSEGYTLTYLANCFGMSRERFKRSLVKSGAKIKRNNNSWKSRKKNWVYQIEGEEVWKAIKKKPDLFNLKEYERRSVLPEPDWLDEAIKSCNFRKMERQDYTIKELLKLKELYNKGYNRHEIAKECGRTADQISKKISNLKKNNEL